MYVCIIIRSTQKSVPILYVLLCGILLLPKIFGIVCTSFLQILCFGEVIASFADPYLIEIVVNLMTPNTFFFRVKHAEDVL